MIAFDKIAEYEIDLAWYPRIVWAYSKKYKSEPVGLKLTGEFEDRRIAMVEVVHRLIAEINNQTSG